MENETRLRWIKDIGCAAALLMQGHDLQEIVQMPNKPVGVMQFNFVVTDALMDDEKRYFDKKIDKDLYTFYSTIRELKARIKNELL